MRIFPTVRHARFSEIEAGSLFLIELLDHRFAAIKTFDEEYKKFSILFLGPTAPALTVPGELVQYDDILVVDLGRDFTVRLPTSAIDWTQALPATDTVAMAVVGSETYVRGLYKQSPGREAWLLVRLSDGTVHDVPRRDPSVFATRWEIVIVDEFGRDWPVVKFPV